MRFTLLQYFTELILRNQNLDLAHNIKSCSISSAFSFHFKWPLSFSLHLPIHPHLSLSLAPYFPSLSHPPSCRLLSFSLLLSPAQLPATAIVLRVNGSFEIRSSLHFAGKSFAETSVLL